MDIEIFIIADKWKETTFYIASRKLKTKYGNTNKAQEIKTY